VSGGPPASTQDLQRGAVASRAAHSPERGGAGQSSADKHRTRRSAGWWQCGQDTSPGALALSLTGDGVA
jgi:hypothetical protein